MSKDMTVGGGIANGAASTATLTNTLLDLNKPFNCAGTLASGGGNIEENATTCGFAAGDLPNAGKLQLKPLKVDHDFGLVPTYELQPTSPTTTPASTPVARSSARTAEVASTSRLRRTSNGGICDSGATEFELA